jgi:hypothetical protein
MLSYLISENGSRTIQKDGYHIIVSKLNLELAPGADIEIETGLIINFDPMEFVLIEIDDSFNNILVIMNPIMEIKGQHLVLKIKNLTKDSVIINQDDHICKFAAFESHKIAETLADVAAKQEAIQQTIQEKLSQESSSSNSDNDETGEASVQVVTENGDAVLNAPQVVSNNRVTNTNPNEVVLNIQSEVPLISLQEGVQSTETVQEITSVNQDNVIVEPSILTTAGEGVITVEQEDSDSKTDNEYDILSRSSSNTSDDMSKSITEASAPPSEQFIDPESKLESVVESQVETTITPVESAVAPIEPAVAPVESAVAPVNTPVDTPVEPAVAPVDTPVDTPVEPAVAPVDTPAEPAVAPVEPVIVPPVAETKVEVKPKRKYQKKKAVA